METENLAPNVGFGWVPVFFGHRGPHLTGENPGRQIRHSWSGAGTGNDCGQDGRSWGDDGCPVRRIGPAGDNLKWLKSS
jgi:hypothetical protein